MNWKITQLGSTGEQQVLEPKEQKEGAILAPIEIIIPVIDDEEEEEEEEEEEKPKKKKKKKVKKADKIRLLTMSFGEAMRLINDEEVVTSCKFFVTK